MRLAILLILCCLGCPSKEPSSTVPNEVFVTPASASAPSATAPVVASTPPSTDASDASAPLHGPRGKPTSFGGGIPGECINCPPTGCPKSCDDLMKKK